VVLLLVLIQDFESLNCFLEGARICLGFFGCLVDYLAKIAQVDKRDNRTDQMLMKRSGLPEAKTDPVIKILFSLISCIEGETIGAGMLQRFAGIHAFAQDEKGERASLLIGAVSGDFLHIESFLEVIPIFPLAPLPQIF
jgi:hypothetical protein